MPAYITETRESGGRRQLVVALALFVAAVSMAFLPTPRQQQIAQVVRATVLRPFVFVQGGVADARNNSVGSGTLQRQLDSLVAVTTGHLTLADENRKLRSLLGLRDRIGAGWITANVLRAGTSGSESTFMLDVGSEQGVARYAPVVTGQGIVGVVLDVYPNSAMAMDWTHPDFRVSAMDAQGTVYGIVLSSRGEFREEDRMEFDGTAFQARLEDGTAVVTSDQSGWPRGVPIGKVEGLAEADAGWRKSYWLRPMIEVGSISHVLVGVSPARDLYGVWPIEQMLTDAEVAQQLQAREDSVQMLRAVLAAPRPKRDSLVAALLLEGQSPFAAAAGAAPTDSTGAVVPTNGATNGQTGGAPHAPADSAARGSDGRGSPLTTGQPRTPTGEPAGAPVRPVAPSGPPDSTTGRPDSTPRPTDTTPARPDTAAPQPGPPRPGGTPGARPDTAFSALRLDPASSRYREGGADRR